MSNPWVVCAAMKMTFTFADHVEERVVCSPRHYDTCIHSLLHMIDDNYLACRTSEEQGFVDQRGNFLSREEAWHIASKNGQIKRRCGSDEYVDKEGNVRYRLFSENIY